MDRREAVYQETAASESPAAVPVMFDGPGRAEIIPAPGHPTASPVTPACLNCGTTLSGPYCAHCGQHVADYHQSVWRFVTDFFDNTFCWDNKTLRTFAPLFRRPGFLTCEFMAGRRVRYVHPLRLFLFTSAVCITLWHFGGDPSRGALPRQGAKARHDSPAPHQSTPAASAAAPEKNALAEDQPAPPSLPVAPSALPRGAEASLTRLGVTFADPSASPASPAGASPSDSPAAAASPAGDSPEAIRAKVKAEVKAALKGRLSDKNAAGVLDLGDRIDRKVETKLAADGMERITKNISDGVRQRLSWVALGLLPVFALMLRGLYWRKDSFYFLHLVFSLHYHTFLLVFWTVHGWLDTLLHHSGVHFLAKWYLLAAPVYLYLALRQVYGGSGRRTWVKVTLLGAMHLLAIAVGLASVGALSVFNAMQ